MGTWAQRERERGRSVLMAGQRQQRVHLLARVKPQKGPTRASRSSNGTVIVRENVSPSVRTFRDSLRAKSTTPEASHTLLSTRQAHTDQPLRRGRVKDR